ncbi:MAG: anti-sigma factor antagonist [Defluviitaleaceae bacterium]|nr:anti-sigma factor antagonist [Defluviitaleaceae bacterium]
MQININGRVLFATLNGELDHHMAERFRTQLDAAFEKSACRHILLDMSGVSFMDSSGIGMVIGRYKKAEMRGGKLVLAGMSDSVAKLYEMSGLSKIVSRTATTEAAISMLGGPLV